MTEINFTETIEMRWRSRSATEQTTIETVEI